MRIYIRFLGTKLQNYLNKVIEIETYSEYRFLFLYLPILLSALFSYIYSMKGIRTLSIILLAMMVMGCGKDTKRIVEYKQAVYKSYTCSTYMILKMTEAANDYHSGKHYFSTDLGRMVSDEDIDFNTAVIRDYENISLKELLSSYVKEEGRFKNCVRCYSQSEAAYCKKQLFDLIHLYDVSDSLLTEAKHLIVKDEPKLAELIVCISSLHDLSKYEDADYQKLIIMTKALTDNFNRIFEETNNLYEGTKIDVRSVQNEVRNLIKINRGE